MLLNAYYYASIMFKAYTQPSCKNMHVLLPFPVHTHTCTHARTLICTHAHARTHTHTHTPHTTHTTHTTHIFCCPHAVDNACNYQYIEQPPLYIMECNPHAAGQLNLQCTALSRDGNFTIQWKWVPLFTHNIVTLQDVIHLSTSNGTNTFVVVSRLKVLSLSDSDCGTYWCEIVAHNANANPLLRSNVYYLLISDAYGELPACAENIPLRRSVTKCADSGTQPQSRRPVAAAIVNHRTETAVQMPLPTHVNQHGSPVTMQTLLPTHANQNRSPSAIQTPSPTHINQHGSPTAAQSTTLFQTPALTASQNTVTSTVSLTISPSQLLTDDMCITEFNCPRNSLLLIILISFIILSIVVIGLLITCIIAFCFPKKGTEL